MGNIYHMKGLYHEENIYREIYENYAGAVAYIAAELKDGKESIGSAFHVGEEVFDTTRHVLDDVKIIKIGTAEHSSVNNKTNNEKINSVKYYFSAELDIIKG